MRSVLVIFLLAVLTMAGCGGGDTGKIDNSQYHPGNGQTVPDEGPPPHNYQPGD